MNTPKLAVTAVTLFGALLWSGCASVMVKKPAIDNVKSMAIVGYSTKVDMSAAEDKDTKTSFGAMTNAIKGSATAEDREARRRDQAEKAYAGLYKTIGEATGWKVLEREAIEGNADYQQRVAAQGAPPTLAKMLRADVVEQMSPLERAALCKALGVDAIATVSVDYVVGSISGVAFGGMGKRTKHPKAVIHLSVFDAGSPDPVWKDRRAEGQPTEEGLARTMGIDSDENETPLMLEASQTAFQALAERYKEAKAK